MKKQTKKILIEFVGIIFLYTKIPILIMWIALIFGIVLGGVLF